MVHQVTQPLGLKLESGSGSSLKSGQSAEANVDKNMAGLWQSQVLHHQAGSSTTVGGSEEPPAGVFLQTAAYLLDVHVLKVHSIVEGTLYYGGYRSRLLCKVTSLS